MEYAGRLHRFAAFAIDVVVISVIIVVLGAIGVINLGEPSSTDQLLEAVISFGYYVVSAPILFLGYVWILFDGKRQGWHDKIGGTFVVKAR